MTEPSAEAHVVSRAMDWAYERALDGVGSARSAQDLAEEYLAGAGSLETRVERLIRWQAAKSSVSGFVTGIGGLPALPLTLPLNVTSVLFVQLRMVAAIAHMGGHDVTSDRVRTIGMTCLLGNAAKDVLKDAGIQIGAAMTRRAVSHISQQTLEQLNRRVGFRLISAHGPAVVRLGRLAPFVGGAIGATFDGASTYATGQVARRAFVCT